MSQTRVSGIRLGKLDALIVLLGYLAIVGLAFALRDFGDWAMRGSDELAVFTGMRMVAEAIPYAACMIPSVVLHGCLTERFWMPLVKSGRLGWFNIAIFISAVFLPPMIIMWTVKAMV